MCAVVGAELGQGMRGAEELSKRVLGGESYYRSDGLAVRVNGGC